MTALELLAPARNADIGIAAIDCGADAIYIAGPSFGARKDAGNPVSEIRRLCEYAHRFAARVFLTVNISLRDDELEEVHSLMLQAQEAGVDAFIIRDMRICGWDDITVPLHASTQCSVRTPERALELEKAGCSRIVLERELSLQQVAAIRQAVSCELEFFVHGALCVCYSGECTLSEHIDGRSADRGECIQACRSLYDLVDDTGRVLVRNKALLSLKDYRLLDRLEDLAGTGIMSFKIEGRLKNASYVKNVVREYSDALDRLISDKPEAYCRASWGHPVGGFTPDSSRTFNRGYTTLFLDGKRGKWSSMDIPKSVGETVGTVKSIRPKDKFSSVVEILPAKKGLSFRNGDGFAFATRDGVSGFRADVAEGNRIVCRSQADLKQGDILYRNISAEFERALERDMCRREIPVSVRITASSGSVEVEARSEDGREVRLTRDTAGERCRNVERLRTMVSEGIGKHSGIYSFSLESFSAKEGEEPLLTASFINGLRRSLAEEFDRLLPARDIRPEHVAGPCLPVQERKEELMRTKYCIKYELGLCKKNFPSAEPTGKLFLLNNGRRLSLGFDCEVCEMTVRED